MSLNDLTQLIQGTTQATTITKVDTLTTAICGEQKSGKSYLVAKTCRKPLLMYDFDKRRESIAGIDGVIIKTLYDVESVIPKAWGELETDLGSLEWLKKEGKLDLKSICFDSMTFLRKFAENEMIKATSLKRSAKIGLSNYVIGQGWDSVNYIQRMLEQLIRRVQMLEIDFYCTFHTAPQKDKVKSTKENTVYTDKITIDPNYLASLLTMFNEVWRCYIDPDGQYKVQTKADYYFNANTSLSIDNVEEANIEAILAKHEKRYKK